MTDADHKQVILDDLAAVYDATGEQACMDMIRHVQAGSYSRAMRCRHDVDWSVGHSPIRTRWERALEHLAALTAPSKPPRVLTEEEIEAKRQIQRAQTRESNRRFRQAHPAWARERSQRRRDGERWRAG